MQEELLQLERRVQLLEEDNRDLRKALEPIKENNIRNDEKYNQILNTLNEVRDDVKAFKARPVKFWDYVITTVIASAVAFLITHIGG